MLNTVSAIIAILIGLLVTFAGFRIFKMAIPLLGLVAGYYIGRALFPSDDQVLLALIVAAIVGGGLLILVRVMWNVVSRIAGGILGFFLGLYLGGVLLSTSTAWALLLGLAVGLLSAWLFPRASGLMIVLLTAFTGAAAVLVGVSRLFPSLANDGSLQSTVIPGLIFLALGGVGCFVQNTSRRRVKGKA